MQGAPLFAALGELGVDANEIKDVILTHLHFDHAEGLAAWPQRRTIVHRLETEAPYAQIVAGQLEMANLEVVDGEEGEIEPGVRWIRTPGHSDGLITLLVDTDDGLSRSPPTASARCPSTSTRWTCPRTSGPSARSCWSSGGRSAIWTPRRHPRPQSPRPAALRRP